MLGAIFNRSPVCHHNAAYPDARVAIPQEASSHFSPACMPPMWSSPVQLLSYFSFVNLNFVSLFSFSCLFELNFYHELLTVTLVPAVLLLMMGATLWKATRRCNGRPYAVQEAVARHSGIGLLIAFLVSRFCKEGYVGVSRSRATDTFRPCVSESCSCLSAALPV